MSHEQKQIIQLQHPIYYPTEGTPVYDAMEKLGNYYDLFTHEEEGTRGLKIVKGISDDHIGQLIEKSRQPHITETTPNDRRTRFISQVAFNDWQAKHPDRSFFTLSSPENDLAGVIWFTPAVSPNMKNLEQTPKLSFAIRLYENYVTRGLALPFMTVAHAAMANSIYAAEGAWLETGVHNKRARHTYERFGYIALAKALQPDKKRVHMVLSPEWLTALNVVRPDPGA